MTRATLGATNAAEVVKPTLRLEYLCQVVLPSVTLRGSTGDTDVPFGGNTYYGNAKFVGFSNIIEVPDLKARKVSIQLSGLDPQLVSAAINDKFHFAEISLYIAMFNEAGALIADPHQIGTSLYASNMPIRLGEGTGSIDLQAETLEVFNKRNSAVLATPESQKLRYAGDTGMDNVRKISEMEFEWGGVRKGPVATGTGGRTGTQEHDLGAYQYL